MEEKKEMDEGLFKSRSYLSCLNEGLKLPTRHILSLLRFLYPSLIAGAVVMGLWGVCFNQITVALTRWPSHDQNSFHISGSFSWRFCFRSSAGSSL